MSPFVVLLAAWGVVGLVVLGVAVGRSTWLHAALPRLGKALGPLLAIPLVAVASVVVQSAGPVERGSVDLSSAHRKRLSGETRGLLQALGRTGDTVRITAFVPERRTEWQDVVGLVRRLEAAGGGLSARFVDPDRRPSEARRYGVTGLGDVFVEGAGRTVRADSPSERDVTTAILRVTKEPRRLCWSTGHGERALDDPALAAARATLERNAFQLVAIRLGRPGTDLGACGAVVVANPRAAPLPEEQAIWAGYLAGRGRALLLLDPDESPDAVADTWAHPVGVSALPGGAVADAEGALAGDPRALVAERFPSSHPIMEKVASLLFLRTRAFAVPEDGAEPGATTSVLVTASPAARVVGVEAPPLAVAFDRSGVREGPAGDEEIVRARVAVFGDIDWAQNQALPVLGNESVLVRTANWLTEADTLVAIRSTPPAERLALATPRDMDRLYLYTMVLPLLALGAVGAVRWRLSARARSRS